MYTLRTDERVATKLYTFAATFLPGMVNINISAAKTAECGWLRSLEWMHDAGCPLSEDHYEAAAEGGHLHVIRRVWSSV